MKVEIGNATLSYLQAYARYIQRGAASQMIAALFVQTNGAYFGLPDVDPWDEARDARKYLGPNPVVAHPPCSRWCKPLAKVNQTRYGHKIGDDGGCFYTALCNVMAFGGVLEHPANSYAWDRFFLPKPKRGKWVKDDRRRWVTEVSQSAYGHQARKNTWLLYHGKTAPPSLDWSDPKGTHLTSFLKRTSRVAPRLSKKDAIKTPPAFRDMLLALARHSNQAGSAPKDAEQKDPMPRRELPNSLGFPAQRRDDHGT